VPAALDHAPVGFIAVHGDLHASAAARDRGVKRAVVEFRKPGFQPVDIFERGRFPDVPAVQQNVDAGACDPLSLNLPQQDKEVIDMEWTLPSESSPRKWKVPFEAFTPSTSSCQASLSKMRPVAIDSLTSLAPWLYT
jgi:hypothetical protein